MYFFTFIARPLSSPKSGFDTCGAYVNCWIEAIDLNTAESRARELIGENDWRVVALRKCSIVDDDSYDCNNDGKEYYEQACIDKEVLVFHEWPKSGEEESEDDLRLAFEVAHRCIILNAVCEAGHRGNRKIIVKWLKSEDLWAYASPQERDLLTCIKPSRQQLIEATWKIEALKPLVWSLYLIPELGAPTMLTDATIIQNVLPTVGKSVRTFVSLATLRLEEVILDAYEVTYQNHWKVRDAQINDRDIPEGINPEVIQERHLGFNWLIGYDRQDWDDITTDT